MNHWSARVIDDPPDLLQRLADLGEEVAELRIRIEQMRPAEPRVSHRQDDQQSGETEQT